MIYNIMKIPVRNHYLLRRKAMKDAIKLSVSATLMGVLELLYDRGVPLLDVQCMRSKTSN